MKLFSVVFLVVFAVIGIIAFIKEISCFLLRSKKDGTVIFVTPIGKNCENAEFLLRSAAARVKWLSRGKNDCVICLDCDMDDETKKICEKISNDYGFIKIVGKNDFFDIKNITK